MFIPSILTFLLAVEKVLDLPSLVICANNSVFKSAKMRSITFSFDKICLSRFEIKFRRAYNKI